MADKPIKAKFARRENTEGIEPVVSDRATRLARLLSKAATVMESAPEGHRWLTSPQVGLGGAIPLEYAETDLATREVEDLLGRIEYSVYS